MSFVNECPAPPAYYKAFAPSSGQNVFEPPEIPDDFCSSEAYNNLWPAKSSTETMSAGKTGTEIKDRLVTLLKQLVTEALDPPTCQEQGKDLNLSREKLDSTIDEAYSILKSLHLRQAREQVCRDLQLQVKQLQSAEAALKEALKDVSAILEEAQEVATGSMEVE